MRQSVYSEVLFACADGAIYKKGKGRVRPHVNTDGYHEVRFMHGGVRKNIMWHRVIARSYVAGYFDGAHVNHKDANKTNNLPSNLEWVTHRQNVDHAVANDLYVKGERVHNAKLTDAKVREIRAMNAAGVKTGKIAKLYGVSRFTVRDVLSGRQWKHVV